MNQNLPDLEQMLDDMIQQHLATSHIVFQISPSEYLTIVESSNESSDIDEDDENVIEIPNDPPQQDEPQQEQQIPGNEQQQQPYPFGSPQQFLDHLRDLIQSLRLQGPSLQVEAYMEAEIQLESGDEQPLQGRYQHQTPKVIKETSDECYVCLVDQTEFNETCGDPMHLICSKCFEKLPRFKGCPMCRKDLIGLTGREKMNSFFNNNTSIYEELYNYYSTQSNNQFLFNVSCNFGELSNKQDFLKQLKQRCFDLIESVCNEQNYNNIAILNLLESIVLEPNIPQSAIKQLADTLLYDYHY